MVVGIMPPGFSFPRRSDLWIPLADPWAAAQYSAVSFGDTPMQTIARLADGVSIGVAAARMAGVWQRAGSSIAPADSSAKREFQRQVADFRAQGFVHPLRRTLVGDRATPLLVLFGATALLLIIACANVTNLLFAQAAMRRREIAVRAVLGATRSRIAGQLLAESLLLAIAGTALGVLLAPLLLHVVNAVMPPLLAGLSPATIDWRVVTFAAALALVTGIGFGLWPALGAARADLGETMKGGGGFGATAGGARRARRLLLGGELALSVALLVGAGLMLRSFARIMGVDSGVRPEHVGTLAIALRSDESPAVIQGTEARILTRLRATPGIQAAGLASVLPLGGAAQTITFRIRGMRARFLMASRGYFAAMGIPLLRGRDFTPADDSLAPDVVVIDRAMADSLWPGLNPIGRLLPLGGERHFTVVGVVGSVRETSLTQRPLRQMYFSIYQSTPADVALVVRSTLPSTVLLSRMQQAVHAVVPTQPVYNVRMMNNVVSTSVAPQRTNTVLINLFGALALVLTALGVYAVVSYSVAQRRRELGIRAALGATAGALVTLVVREMAWVTVLGLGAGLAAAWVGARVVRSLLYGVQPHDPATYVLATLVLLVPVAIATLVPAHRAGRTDPADVIREE
jgi:predicted permease